MKFSKRMFLMLLTVMLLGSVLSLPAFAAESDCIQGIAFVSASSLRLRGEASTSGKILGSAAKNEVIVLLGKEGDWYKVNYNLTVGYMHKDYLKTATKENAELGYGKVTASAVNLRQKPWVPSFPSRPLPRKATASRALLLSAPLPCGCAAKRPQAARSWAARRRMKSSFCWARRAIGTRSIIT